MKLVTYRSSTSRDLRGGILVGDLVIDLERGFQHRERAEGRPSQPSDIAQRYGSGILGFVEHADVARSTADALVREHAKAPLGNDLTVPLADVTLASPLPRPPSMRDGYAFRQHVATARKNRGLEMIPEFDQFPVFYFTNHQAVIGPGDLHIQKLHTDKLDFELEAAIVLGKGGKNVRAEDADELIFGLTIMNDFSARTLQMEEMKLSLGPAKGKDFATDRKSVV